MTHTIPSRRHPYAHQAQLNAIPHVKSLEAKASVGTRVGISGETAAWLNGRGWSCFRSHWQCTWNMVYPPALGLQVYRQYHLRCLKYLDSTDCGLFGSFGLEYFLLPRRSETGVHGLSANPSSQGPKHKRRHSGASKNTPIQTLNSGALMRGTPTKRTPSFLKQSLILDPYDDSAEVGVLHKHMDEHKSNVHRST